LFYSRLGRFDKLFFLLVVLYLGWSFLAPSAAILALLGFLVYVFAVVELVRLLRWWIKKIIWRLRTRLIVAYVFVAFVPIVLILALAALSIYALTGGVASYLVASELERRVQSLRNQANFLARRSAADRPELLNRLLALWRDRYPAFQVSIEDTVSFRYPETSTLSVPPEGWKDSHGIVSKDGQLFLWAFAQNGKARVTLMSPVDQTYLSDLVPGVGDVFFLNASAPDGDQGSIRLTTGKTTFALDQPRGSKRERIPPKYNRFDIQIAGVAPLQLAHWTRPNTTSPVLLVVHTRTSALLRIVYGQSSGYFGQGVLYGFILISIVFLVVEIVSLVVGISITRTITGAVHELYEGTQRVREGDFSHRIHVKGSDQISELAHSFNRMTEDLQRLFVVEKEKERMESELEIAREVQKELFPKTVPEMRSVRLAGVCHPARTVSGDYYDFLRVDHGLAIAIGDVAGKGISAALLMAAIQSTMRTQLTAGASAALAAAAGNGGRANHFSTAHIVAQLNNQLYANTSPEKYATFCFGLYDDNSGVLTYTNAGHLPPLLVRGGEPIPLDVTGTVVGAFPFVRFEEKSVPLVAGDVLVAYTDGIVEPENEYGEQFGDERLRELLVKYHNADGNEIIARVMECVESWTGGGELQDDMTMVVIRRV
jgi:sigma-B regulation protein RsbU (phosphoserine phosphatase)